MVEYFPSYGIIGGFEGPGYHETETSYVSVMTSLDLISDVRYIKLIPGDKYKLFGFNQDELMTGDVERAPNEG